MSRSFLSAKIVKYTKQAALAGGMLALLTACGSTAPAPSTNTAPAANSTGSPGAAGAGNTAGNSTNAGAPNSSGSTSTHKTYAHEPAMTIDKSKNYVATVNTSDGTFKIQLFAKDSPITVNNFVFLSNDHFYDHVKFHRIIKSFMIQTGDPLGNGTGGPGYTIEDELPPKVPYAPGIVAMARTQAPHSAGSQFFICTGPDSQTLSPDYAVFGKVISGMDVVNKIASTPVGMNEMGEQSKPTQDVLINTITIQ